MTDPLAPPAGKSRPNISWTQVITLLLSVAYPFVVFFGLARFSVKGLALLLALLFALRLAADRSARRLARGWLPLILIVAALCALTFFRNDGRFLLFYPVAVSGVLLVGFALTLRRGPSMIERFARLKEPGLPPAAVAYCRKVTVVWCVFFVCNGLIALGTALHGDLKLWTLYNGLISYALIGLLFAIELLVRLRVKRRHQAAEGKGT